MIFPGFINAHDHLEFALFPRLGRGPYPNAASWAEEIYKPEEEPLKIHLSVPKGARLRWGGLRNLLCGVTTVCHHNPYDADSFARGFPIRVVNDLAWAHSLAFSPDWSKKLAAAPADWPFVIHAAEGTDEKSRLEIFEMDRLGGLGDRTVLVHAVGLDDDGWRLALSRGVSVVWCPSSNRFLLGHTIPVDRLRGTVPISLGTDSPLTADGDLFDEIAAALAAGAKSREIYAMVTEAPARALRLTNSPDFVVVSDTGGTPAEVLTTISRSDIRLVIVGGQVRLADAPLPGLELQCLDYGGVKRWVAADLRSLWAETVEVLDESDIRLGGKPVRICS